MLSPYRAVLGLPGALAFSAAGVVARLPLSMAGLGIVLLVSDRTGSYASAGGISAAYIAANAVFALPLARMVDRYGQSRVLAPAATVSALGLGLLVLVVQRDVPAPVPHLCAAVAGLAFPNVGGAVRARWSHVVTDRTQLDTAFALESVNDEVVFIVGPTLVTVLVSAVHPVAGLLTAATCALAGTWWFAAQRRTEPPVHRSESSASRPPSAAMPWAALAPLALTGLLLGVMFGGCEVAVVAFADEAGHRSASGAVLAVWALGSLLAGVVAGSITFRRSAADRYLAGVLSLAVLMLPLPFVGSLPVLGVLMFLAGFAIAPTMIAVTSLIEELCPATRLNEGLAAFSTALVAGVAPGAALVGVVVDAHGASPSFWVPATAALTGAAAGLVLRAQRRPAPARG